MRAKVTVSVDEKLLPVAREHARARGLSLSQLVEEALRDTTCKEARGFAEKWRGQFKLEDKKDQRFHGLLQRYG